MVSHPSDLFYFYCYVALSNVIVKSLHTYEYIHIGLSVAGKIRFAPITASVTGKADRLHRDRDQIARFRELVIVLRRTRSYGIGLRLRNKVIRPVLLWLWNY